MLMYVVRNAVCTTFLFTVIPHSYFSVMIRIVSRCMACFTLIPLKSVLRVVIDSQVGSHTIAVCDRSSLHLIEEPAMLSQAVSTELLEYWLP
jgi:hypothetical protein